MNSRKERSLNGILRERETATSIFSEAFAALSCNIYSMKESSVMEILMNE